MRSISLPLFARTSSYVISLALTVLERLVLQKFLPAWSMPDAFQTEVNTMATAASHDTKKPAVDEIMEAADHDSIICSKMSIKLRPVLLSEVQSRFMNTMRHYAPKVFPSIMRDMLLHATLLASRWPSSNQASHTIHIAGDRIS